MINSKQQVKALLASTLFQNASDDELARILDCLELEVIAFPKGDYLLSEGDPLVKIGIVLEGSMALTKMTPEGDRVILAILEKGKAFGALTTFSQRETWPCSMEAHRTCMVVFIPKEKVLGLCEKRCPSHDLLIKNTLQAIGEEALMLFNKIEILSLKSPREKILTFLREEYTKGKKTILKLPLDREELADYLNISRPSLSRELGKLRDEGIINFHKAIIKIEDLSKVIF